MKRKIAICISGEMRGWEIMKNIYSEWDVDFFISTWDTTNRGEDNYPYKFHGNSNINDEILEVLKPKGYEFLSKEIENKFTFNLPKHYYLIHRCNLLKTQYELNNKFTYDVVVMTRPDVYHKKLLISQIQNHPKEPDKPICEFEIYGDSILQREELFGASSMDAVIYGTSATMDIFSSIYKHIYLSGDYQMIPLGHAQIPHYVNYIGHTMKRHNIIQKLLNKVRNADEYKELMEKHNV